MSKRRPLPRIDGPVVPYVPLNSTSADLREQYERLTAIAKDKRCRVCHAPISIALRYVEEEHRQEHYLRCGCWPEEPQLYKPETPVEFYRRTGTGDAVTIMQEERRRNKQLTQELMLARIAEVERMDEDQIIQEIAGDHAKEYVYEFPMDGKTVRGLSWAGYKELLIRWGNVRIEQPMVEDLSDSLRVVVEATDLVHNVTVWAGTHQMKKRKINGRNGQPDRWIDDDYAFEKAISKAQRNVVKNVIPHAVQQAAIQAVLTGQAIPIGRTSDEAPTPRLPQSKNAALTEGIVNKATGEILEETPVEQPAFADKGQVMAWYKSQHGLTTTQISAHYPEDRSLQDLSIEDVIEAAETARAEG